MSRFRVLKEQIKEELLKDYLSGMRMRDIQIKYGFNYPATIYFHLGKLTPEQKQQHRENKI